MGKIFFFLLKFIVFYRNLQCYYIHLNSNDNFRCRRFWSGTTWWKFQEKTLPCINYYRYSGLRLLDGHSEFRKGQYKDDRYREDAHHFDISAKWRVFYRVLNLAKNTAKFLIKDKRQMLLIFITMFSGAYEFIVYQTVDWYLTVASSFLLYGIVYNRCVLFRLLKDKPTFLSEPPIPGKNW